MGIILDQEQKQYNYFDLKCEIKLFDTNTLTLNQIFQKQSILDSEINIIYDQHSQETQTLLEIFRLLQLQYDLKQEVDKFEFLTVLILFNSNSTFEKKIEQIFSLINKTGTLNFEEFFWIIQTIFRVTCKINVEKIPTFEYNLKFAQRVFQQMRKDIDDNLMLIEIIDFIKSNSDISGFFLKYYRIQTFENAVKQQRLFLNKYIDIFNQSQGLSQKYINVLSLQQNWNFDKDQQQYLISLMIKPSYLNKKQDNNNLIKFSQFVFVMSNYASFKANDINNTNILPFNFINYLVYSQDEVTITNQKYHNYRNNMLKDRPNITLHMWMNYQCDENKFESQLRFFTRYYELLYANENIYYYAEKAIKLIKTNQKQEKELQNLIHFLQNIIQQQESYQVGNTELKQKIDQLLQDINKKI